MKTFVLATVSAAALLAAGSAFAAAPTDPTQADATTTALNARSGSPETSYVQQQGNNNTAYVDQTGNRTFLGAGSSNQSAVVVQGWQSAYGFDGNAAAGDRAENAYASVTQSGNNATDRAVVMQLNYGSYDKNSATITQSNSGSKDAFAYQFGNNDTATIEQTGGSSAQSGTNNGFDMKTVEGHANGEGVASTLANGATNFASQLMTGGARVVQDETSYSKAEVHQTGSSADHTGATIEQSHGWGDEAYVYQTGGQALLGGDHAFSYQNGHDNLSYTNQKGTDDRAVTLQIGSASGSGASDATNNNKAYTYQGGINDYAFTQQSGTGNYAFTNQNDASYSQSYITQSGSGQVANVTQSGGGLLTGGNLSVVSQTGMNNNASVSQSGSGDNSVVNQYGTGSTNYAVVKQETTNNSWSNLIQSGSNNYANVHQH